MSPDDGRRIMKAIRHGMLQADERREILLAYGWPAETPMTEINSAVAYLEQILATISDREEERLLLVSY